MTELLLFATEPSWWQKLIFFIGAWLTGMGMIVSGLVIVGFFVLIAIGMSHD